MRRVLFADGGVVSCVMNFEPSATSGQDDKGSRLAGSVSLWAEYQHLSACAFESWRRL